jgi:preprotein translocase subunit SecG
MQEIVFIIHILAAVCLILLVLIQHGKGADMGAAFGSGASNTVFGSIGSVPFLIKVTTLIAAIFFATSVTLGVMVAKQAKQTKMDTSIPMMPLEQNGQPR